MSARVLIVDDEPNVVISLEYLMKREGLEVEVAQDGETALAVLADRPASLVILDVMLPGMNGFEVCERLRGRPGLERTKVLMLTARGRDTEIAKGMSVGADAYVTKPFSTKDLVAQVKTLLAGA
jgi:DNA-binding response OmpR family regulator